MIKPMKQNPVRERRKFDETFKREAVLNWLHSGKSAAVVGEELGIDANRLYAWRKLVPSAVAGGGGGGGRQAAHGGRPGTAVGGRAARAPPRAGTVRHSKKNAGYPLRTALQRYERIDAMKTEHSIRTLCFHLEVSASGYYDWQKRRVSPCQRTLQDQSLVREIDQIHAQSRQTYGSPRVERELRKKGRCHGRNRIARLMKQKGLCGRQKRRYRVRTTDSHHDQPIAPNRLAQAPKPTAPNQIWVADITCIETKEGCEVASS